MSHLSSVSFLLSLLCFLCATVQCTVLRSNNGHDERELILNRCTGCGLFRNTMRRISPDDSCVEACRFVGLSTRSGWECGTCEEWNQSYPGFDTTLYLRKVRSQSRRKIFQDAAAQWNDVITGDLPSVMLPANAKSFFCPARSIPRVIDDILICVSVQSIDGRGGILGQAGAEYIRTDSKIPLLGGMVFDEADVDFMVQQGIFDEVIVSLLFVVL